MIASNFNRLAHPYRWMEYASFGPCLEHCRRAQLAHLAGARRALVLGDGDGRFLKHLLASNPLLTADVVDSSRSMLRVLDRRIRRMGEPFRRRIRLHHADALCWRVSGSYDLVVSHFFLDCFHTPQLDQLFDRLLPHLEREARWVISEFSIPSHPPASYLTASLSRWIVGFLYRSFGLLTGLRVRKLPDYALSLHRRGLTLDRETHFLGGLLQSQLWLLGNR
jgi:cyclopropane fatty-acyl-phospholipid synthase-like methyltransferase